MIIAASDYTATDLG
jgi:hypothetical protein